MQNRNIQNLNSVKGIPGPGRPKGSVSGRTLVLKTLDRILAQEKTQEKIATFYRSRINEDLQSFLINHVYPFIPKEAKLLIENDIAVLIKGRAQQLVESIQDDIEKTDVS